MTFCWLIVLASVLELGIVWVVLDYARRGKRGFRLITRESLSAYYAVALLIGGVCAAGLWTLLPLIFGSWGYGEAPWVIRLSASGLTVGAVTSGLFILAIYRMYELKEEDDELLGPVKLGVLLVLAFLALSGFLQGAWFLIAAIWGSPVSGG